MEQGITAVVMRVKNRERTLKVISSFIGATTVARLPKSTLGPKGLGIRIQNVVFENSYDL